MGFFLAATSFYHAYFIVLKCLCDSLGTENLPITQRDDCFSAIGEEFTM